MHTAPEVRNKKFRRTNNRQNQINSPEPKIREEQKTEAEGIGTDILRNISNEANVPAAKDPLDHYKQDDLNKYSLKKETPRTKNHQKAVISSMPITI